MLFKIKNSKLSNFIKSSVSAYSFSAPRQLFVWKFWDLYLLLLTLSSLLSSWLWKLASHKDFYIWLIGWNQDQTEFMVIKKLSNSVNHMHLAIIADYNKSFIRVESYFVEKKTFELHVFFETITLYTLFDENVIIKIDWKFPGTEVMKYSAFFESNHYAYLGVRKF